MHIPSGRIGPEEEMKQIYGEDQIKPIPAESAPKMSNWGRKKRVRYAELLDLGKDTVEAFDIVENRRGIIN